MFIISTCDVHVMHGQTYLGERVTPMRIFNSKNRSNQNGILAKWRYIAATMAIIIFVAAVVIFADYGNYGGYSGQAPYQMGAYVDTTALIHVQVDHNGSMHITPYDLA